MKIIYQLSVILFSCSLIACNEEIPKGVPQIIWEDPADISFGTDLTSKQLNASASVPGTFDYTPPLGSSLDAGDGQELSVLFTPDDKATNATASKTVLINVSEGSDAIFNDNLTYGKVVDIEGNSYKTITIGTQTWMAENLRTTSFRNGDEIPEVQNNEAWRDLTSPGQSSYLNTSDLDEIAAHGRLYNWKAVTDIRNIAPEGWHVASDEEWTTLVTFLGGEVTAGGKLKETSQSHWNAPNTGADNSSGFTGLPSGRREYADGSFLNIGFNTFWWTSTTYDGNYAWYRYMNYDETNIYRANFHSTYGYAVRCVKDI